jgi:hypothetical protein
LDACGNLGVEHTHTTYPDPSYREHTIVDIGGPAGARHYDFGRLEYEIALNKERYIPLDAKSVVYIGTDEDWAVMNRNHPGVAVDNTHALTNARVVTCDDHLRTQGKADQPEFACDSGEETTPLTGTVSWREGVETPGLQADLALTVVAQGPNGDKVDMGNLEIASQPEEEHYCKTD